VKLTSLRITPLAAALVAALLIAGCGLQQSDAAVANGGLPSVKGPATPISAPTLSGKQFDWSSTHGHVVVLDFWASWCGPCNHEQPQLNQIAAEWMPKGVVFLGVDLQDTNANGAAFERSFKVPYPSVNDADEVITSDYNVPSPPSIVLVDTHGNIVDRFLGTLTGVTSDLTRLTS
jgi:thiol-disulfide isomerase/thioredoxin